MKVKIAVLIILSILSSLTAVRGWRLYTNTTHVYDFKKIDKEIYIATWGGVEVYNLETGEMVDSFVRESGFESMKTNSIEYAESSGDILIGSDENGVYRYNDGKFQIGLKNQNGLPVNNVNDLVVKEDLIYVATDQGLAVYDNNSEYPFPLVENIFNSSTGLDEDNIESLVVTENNYLLCIRSNSIDYVHADSMLIINSWHNIDAHLLGENVTEIISCDENNKKVVFSVNNGLIVWDDFPNGNYNPLDIEGIEDGAYPVYVDDENNVWTSLAYWDKNEEIFLHAGTTELLKIMSDGTFSKYDLSGVTDKAISNIEIIDDKIFLGTWGDGILFQNDNDEWISIKSETICTNPVTELEADNSGRLWVCNGFMGINETKSSAKGVSVFNYQTETWKTYTFNNSDLTGNNIFSLYAGNDGSIWMGAYGPYSDLGWANGLSVLHGPLTYSETWQLLNNTNGLAGSTIAHISMKDDDEVWISSYGSGLVAYNIFDDSTIRYEVPGRNQTVEIMITEGTSASDGNQIWFGSKHDGLKVWNSWGVPESDIDNRWILADVPELRASCEINGFAHYKKNGKDDYWITSNKGIFFYDNIENKWHKLGIIYKRETLINGYWQLESNYDKYYDEEPKLFGAANATPTCIEIDVNGDVWIGSADYGISVYNYENDSYSLYDKENTVMMTNFITDLELEGHSGRMYVGTTEGLVSVEAGKNKRSVSGTSDMIVYPNPFYPDNGDVLKIKNSMGNGSMPSRSYKCRIFDVSGRLVAEMEQNVYYEFSWDGKNMVGKDCSSGVYYYMVYDNDGDVQKGKIALIR